MVWLNLYFSDGKLELLFSNLQSPNKEKEPQPLYKYQIEVRMFWLHMVRTGGILGDDMGMGMTKQVRLFLFKYLFFRFGPLLMCMCISHS